MSAPSVELAGSLAQQDDDRRAAESAVRTFLETHQPLTAALELPELNPDERVARIRGVHRRLGEELGVLGIGIAEELGGVDLPFGFAALVAVELGRVVAPLPFSMSSGVVAGVLRRLDADERNSWLAGIATGELVATWVGLEHTAGISVREVGGGSRGYVLDGVLPFVPFGWLADLILVHATTVNDEVVVIALRPGSSPGLDRRPVRTVDETRPAARVELSGCPAVRLAGDVGGAVDLALAEGHVLLAAEALGAATATVEAARNYVSVREQFGRPVGSFQAVQGVLADLYGAVAAAGAATRRAVRTVESGASREAAIAAAVIARLRTGFALREAARQALHLHGGVGFTWEHPAHLYLKRSLGDRDLLGSVSVQRELVAAALTGTTSPGTTPRREDSP